MVTVLLKWLTALLEYLCVFKSIQNSTWAVSVKPCCLGAGITLLYVRVYNGSLNFPSQKIYNNINVLQYLYMPALTTKYYSLLLHCNFLPNLWDSVVYYYFTPSYIPKVVEDICQIRSFNIIIVICSQSHKINWD